MANVILWLDTRRANARNQFPLKIQIYEGRKRANISTSVSLLPNQWDDCKCEVINHPQRKELNATLLCKLAEIERHILDLSIQGKLDGMSAADIKKSYEKSISPVDVNADTFVKVFIRFAEKKQKSTRQLYEFTLSCIRKHFRLTDKLRFEDITPKWLDEFDTALAKTSSSQNYRNIHLRNIRAVFNYAIDEEITTYYPFRKYKIKPVKTRKRSMKVEDLRRLFDYPTEEYAEIYRDMFKLIFMLIGINTIDLHRLQEVTTEGRVEYCRAKTHRLYSIKVEPEAQVLIDKYRGKKGLLVIADRWTNHHNFRHQINKALQLIGEVERKGLGGKKERKPAFPEITTYWARHSWATIAAYLDIPKDTIAAALGHGADTVTDIYIDFDQRKVDIANRKVLDWVLYGKIDGKVIVEPGTPEFYGQKPQNEEKVEEPEPPKQSKTPRAPKTPKASNTPKTPETPETAIPSGLNLEAFKVGIVPKLKP